MPSYALLQRGEILIVENNYYVESNYGPTRELSELRRAHNA
jgi:hypothetical protein